MRVGQPVDDVVAPAAASPYVGEVSRGCRVRRRWRLQAALVGAMDGVFQDARNVEGSLTTTTTGGGAPFGSLPLGDPQTSDIGNTFGGYVGSGLFDADDASCALASTDRRSAGRPPGIEAFVGGPAAAPATHVGAAARGGGGGARGKEADGLPGGGASLTGDVGEIRDWPEDVASPDPLSWSGAPPPLASLSGGAGGGADLFGRVPPPPPPTTSCASAGEMFGNLHLEGPLAGNVPTTTPVDPLLSHKPFPVDMDQQMLLAPSCSIVSAGGSTDGDANASSTAIVPMTPPLQLAHPAPRPLPTPLHPAAAVPLPLTTPGMTPSVDEEADLQVVDDEIEVCDDVSKQPPAMELADCIIDDYKNGVNTSPTQPMHSSERALQLMRKNSLVREWLLRGNAGRPSKGALDNAFAISMNMQFESSGVGPLREGDLVQQNSQLLVLPFATVNGTTMGSIYGASSNGDYGWDASRSNTRFVYEEATGECLTYSWHGAVVIASWFYPRDSRTRDRAVFMFLAPRTPDEEPQHVLTHMSFVESSLCKQCGGVGELCLCPPRRMSRSPTSPVDFSGFDMADMRGDFRGYCQTLVYVAESGHLLRTTISNSCLSSSLTMEEETRTLKRQTLDQLGLLLSSPLADMSMVAAVVPNYRALAATVISCCYSEDEGDGEQGGQAGQPKPKRKRGPRSSELTDEQRALREITRKERNRYHARVSNEKRRIKQARTMDRKRMLVDAVARMHEYLNQYREVNTKLQAMVSAGSRKNGMVLSPASVSLLGDRDGRSVGLGVPRVEPVGNYMPGDAGMCSAAVAATPAVSTVTQGAVTASREGLHAGAAFAPDILFPTGQPRMSGQEPPQGGPNL